MSLDPSAPADADSVQQSADKRIDRSVSKEEIGFSKTSVTQESSDEIAKLNLNGQKKVVASEL
jgi:hypothetical protein